MTDDRRSVWHGRLQLWDDWACYLGSVSQQSFHAHLAAQLALGIDQSVVVETRADVGLRDRALLVAPLMRHRIAPTSSDVLLIYADPRGRLGRRLRSCATQSVLALPGFGRALLESWDRRKGLPDERAIMTALDQGCPAANPPPLDPRVRRALDALDDHGGKQIALIARSRAGVSAGRLRELAQQELGTSLAHFSLWRKLDRSFRAATSGSGLAEAAYAGGFADQAHMARTFRRMLGLTLTDLLGTATARLGSVAHLGRPFGAG